MMPSMLPTYRGGNYTTNTENVRQLWNDVGSCPNRTVAIRRTKIEDVLRAGSLSQFGKKKLSYRSSSLASPPQGHEHAIAYPESTQNQIYGTKATFNIWNPDVEVSGEFSLSQLWVIAGSYGNSDLNTIEAGWQTNNSVAIGGALSPVSTYGGMQYEMTLLVWKDPGSGNWWLKFNDALVGYWPSELFTRLSSYATSVNWGGEIVNTSPNGVHTSTDMGSGRFPAEGFRKASYIRNLQNVDSTNTLYPVQSISTYADHPNCYDVKSYKDTDWGVSFFFGGPGKNSLCT
ncbi:protein neprosin-like isoform X4 [Typha latifolia]|uniref:protein neprosin-like isoform X4 n=1 Tax=Typha latifolia TaxID=4733 RepID=UPI003C3076BE